MLEAFLHDKGYRYIGPQSINRLTFPEIRRLQAGYQAMNHMSPAGNQLRESTQRTLKAFKAKHGLR